MLPARTLDARRDTELRAQLATVLARDGSVATALTHLGHTTAEQWQAAARAAADILQRPVHTGLGACGTVGWAVITDWPRTTEELLRTAQLAHAHAQQAPRAGHSETGRPRPLDDEHPGVVAPAQVGGAVTPGSVGREGR